MTHASALFTSDQIAASRCVLRLVSFLAPPLALLLAIEVSLWKMGDNWPIWLAFQTQQAAPAELLYDRDFFSEQLGVYKLAGIHAKQPKFLVIGSSRVLQMRDFCFTPREAEFYNAGGMLQSLADLLTFVELLENDSVPRPQWLFVGIDPWWLKSERQESRSWLTQGEEVYQPEAHVEALRRASKQHRWSDLFAGYTTTRPLLYDGKPVIGGLALRHGSGFRKDGSRQSPPAILNDYLLQPGYRDRESPPVIDRIRNHFSQFSLPTQYDHSRAEKLLAAFAKLRALGIETWAFFPPFATECVTALEADRDPQFQDWWQRYRHELPAKLRQQGVNVICQISPAEAGLKDDFFLDGFHPSEVFMTHLMLNISAQAPPTSLLHGLDTNQMGEKLKHTRTPLSFE
jgi:hypothetical protein